MELMSKQTFSIEVSDQQATEKASSSSSSLEIAANEESGLNRGIWSGQTVDYSSDSSSIGTPGDSEEDVDEDEDENENDDVSLGLRGLASMSSLEDSLPPSKRGLSNHYKGKSKSFGNLGEIGSSVKEVAKQENPLNKRRRLQICNKLARRSFYSWQNPKSMPLFPVIEDEDDEQDLKFDENNKSSSDDEGEGGEGKEKKKVVTRKGSFKNRAYMSRSCFALSDLIEEEDDDDDDDDQ